MTNSQAKLLPLSPPLERKRERHELSWNHRWAIINALKSAQGKVSSEMWKVKATVGQQNENMIKEKHYSFSFPSPPPNYFYCLWVTFLLVLYNEKSENYIAVPQFETALLRLGNAAAAYESLKNACRPAASCPRCLPHAASCQSPVEIIKKNWLVRQRFQPALNLPAAH